MCRHTCDLLSWMGIEHATPLNNRLRIEHGIWGEVPVLLSLEKPLCKLVSMIDVEGGNVNLLDYQVREEGGKGEMQHGEDQAGWGGPL